MGLPAALRKAGVGGSIPSLATILFKNLTEPGDLAFLTELAPSAVDAFAKDEIGLGVLLQPKLQPQQWERAFTTCCP